MRVETDAVLVVFCSFLKVSRDGASIALAAHRMA